MRKIKHMCSPVQTHISPSTYNLLSYVIRIFQCFSGVVFLCSFLQFFQTIKSRRVEMMPSKNANRKTMYGHGSGKIETKKISRPRREFPRLSPFEACGNSIDSGQRIFALRLPSVLCLVEVGSNGTVRIIAVFNAVARSY